MLLRSVGLILLVVTASLLCFVHAFSDVRSLHLLATLFSVATTFIWWFAAVISSDGDRLRTWAVELEMFGLLVVAETITEGTLQWFNWSSSDGWPGAIMLISTLALFLSAVVKLKFLSTFLFVIAVFVCRYLVFRTSVSLSGRSRVLFVPFVGFLSTCLAGMLSTIGGGREGIEMARQRPYHRPPPVEVTLRQRSQTTFVVSSSFEDRRMKPVEKMDVETVIQAHGLLEEIIDDAPASIRTRLETIEHLLASQAPSMNVSLEAPPAPLRVVTGPSDETGVEDDNQDDDNDAQSTSSSSSLRRRRPRRTMFTTVTDSMGLPRCEEQPKELRSRASTLQFRQTRSRLIGDSPAARRPSSSNDALRKLTGSLSRRSSNIPSIQWDARQTVRKRSRSVDYSSARVGDVDGHSRSTDGPVVTEKPTVKEESSDEEMVSPPMQIVNLLTTVNEWDFDIFAMAELSSDHLLSYMAGHVFAVTGLMDVFHLSSQKFRTYFEAIEAGYHEENPYHNRIHAADVLHACYYFVTSSVPGFASCTPSDSGVDSGSGSSRSGSEESNGKVTINNCNQDSDSLSIAFPPLEVMALFIAAAIHDYDHPARTNAFLVSTGHHLAVLYNDYSVLENHHVASAWKILISSKEFHFLQHLEAAEFKRLRYLVVELVLSTDLKKHFDILSSFSAKCGNINWSSEQDRLLVLQMIIKMADINTPAKPSEIQVVWTDRIIREFYDQGDDEKRLGLLVEQFMDREHPNLERLQVGFIRNLVVPLFNKYAEAGLIPGRRKKLEPSIDEGEDEGGSTEAMADSLTGQQKLGCSSPLMENLQYNFNMWEGRMLEQQMQEAKETFRFVAKAAAFKALQKMGLVRSCENHSIENSPERDSVDNSN